MGLLISTNYQKITTKTYCTRHCYCGLPFIEIIRQFFAPIKLIRVAIKNTYTSIFLKKSKKEQIPNDHLPFSFGIKLFFTNFLLHKVINTALDKKYNKN